MKRASSLRIIVTGLIAQHPRLGGVTWDYLQYLLGLTQLGHDVYYLEDSGQWPYTIDGGSSGEDWIAYDPTPNLSYLDRVMKRFGLVDRWLYRFPIKPRWYGMSPGRRRDLLATADLLLNVSGTLRRPSDYRAIPRLVYIDSDPVFTQVKLNLPHGQLKFQRRAAVHDRFFSFGECLGSAVPGTAYHWRPTRTPIVLDEWNPSADHRSVFSTVMSWTSYRPLTYRRQAYGQKDLEFQRFLLLPRRLKRPPLEIAMGGLDHTAWQRLVRDHTTAAGQFLRGQTGRRPREILRAAGWRIVDAFARCGDFERYRRYVQSSAGEWSVAKQGYVVGRAGWFSCRSACYLAAGRPVVVQDTGFAPVIPVGEGVLTFRTEEEAIRALTEVTTHYRRHARAARELAATYFDARNVLKTLVEEACT